MISTCNTRQSVWAPQYLWKVWFLNCMSDETWGGQTFFWGAKIGDGDPWGKFTKLCQVTDSYKKSGFQHSSSDGDILHSPSRGKLNKNICGVARGTRAGKTALWKKEKKKKPWLKKLADSYSVNTPTTSDFRPIGASQLQHTTTGFSRNPA